LVQFYESPRPKHARPGLVILAFYPIEMIFVELPIPGTDPHKTLVPRLRHVPHLSRNTAGPTPCQQRVTQFDGAKVAYKRVSRLRHTNPDPLTGGKFDVFEDFIDLLHITNTNRSNVWFFAFLGTSLLQILTEKVR
jgi:hypothetical protein